MNQASVYKKSFLCQFLICCIAFSGSLESKTKEPAKAPQFELPKFAPLNQSYKICIVIPAYNEEKRIEKTIHEFMSYFQKQEKLTTTFLIVANNCSDNTVAICKKLQKKYPKLQLMNLAPGGKGFAVKQGFLKALQTKYDLIGFVDADLATTPPYFYELITKIQGHDGAIASRYIKGARVWPQRPFIRRIGGKVYNWILRKRCHLTIKDTQCGAKLFTYDTIKKVTPFMEDEKWAFDLELLYLANLFGKDIVEIPTTWSDMPGSHLVLTGCTKEFLNAPGRIKKRHKKLALKLRKEKRAKKRKKHKRKK